MGTSKYKCHIVNKTYVCTMNKNLSQACLSLKKVFRLSPRNEAVRPLLEAVLASLKAFGKQRNCEEHPRYREVCKQLSLALDVCRSFQQEGEDIRELIMDCPLQMQLLDELNDNAAPEEDGADGKPAYNPKEASVELKITAMHVTRDMSIANRYQTDFFYGLEDLKKMKSVNLGELDGGLVKLLSVSEKAVSLKWDCEEFCVKLGEQAVSDSYMIDNPCLSYDSLHLTFSYRKFPNYKDLFNMIIQIGQDEKEGKDKGRIARSKEDVLHFIDGTIAKGNTGLYVAKALLHAADSWTTCTIVRPDQFRSLLLEGIEEGCLAPDNYTGWDWMEVAAKYNDPTYFMEDMDCYYEVLDSAVRCGVVAAMDIRDTIWEPEQLIEED